MLENKMAEVARLFGKKMGEEFTIRRLIHGKGISQRSRFGEYGVQVLYDGHDYWKYKDNVLCEILTGEAEIVE